MALECSTVTAGEGEFDASVLYEQFFVDPARLSQTVRRSLQRHSQVGLADVIATQPLEQGLSELVTYLSLTDELFAVVFDDQVTEQVRWSDPDGNAGVATIPRVTFTRTARVGTAPVSTADHRSTA